MLLEVSLPTEDQLLSLALAATEMSRDIASAQGHHTIALETLQALITLDEIEPAFYIWELAAWSTFHARRQLKTSTQPAQR